MKLVLVHTDGKEYGPLAKAIPIALFPLFEKPIIQHQIENAYANGLRDVAVIASDGLNAIRDILQDGIRFGVQAELLIGTANCDECESLLKHRFLFKQDLLIQSGLSIGKIAFQPALEAAAQGGKRITLVRRKEDQTPLAAILKPGAEQLLTNSRGDLLMAIEAVASQHSEDSAFLEVETPLPVGKGLDLLFDLNSRALHDPSLLVHVMHLEKEPGLFLGRGTSIHPSARIIPPVLIGNFCQIMAGAEIGPNVAIGESTIVAKKALVRNSIVIGNSYIGEMTRVEKALVASNLLFSAHSGAKVVVTDPFLLGQLDRTPIKELTDSLINRSAALALLVTLAPAGIASAVWAGKKHGDPLETVQVLGSGKVESMEDLNYLPRFPMLRLKDPSLPFSWWPTLYNVLRGEMRLIGPKPLTPDQADRFTEDWKLQRFSSPPGITGAADLEDENEDERIITDNLYNARRSLSLDIRILLARFAKPIIGKTRAKKLTNL